MSCASARALFEQLVDGELSAGAAGAVRAHLRGCAECSAEFQQAVSLPARLKALRGPDAPPGFVESVLRSVAPRSSRLGWALLSAELVLMAAISLYVSGLSGLTGLGAGVAEDVGGVVSWIAGSGPLPSPASADVLLLLAFITLIGLAGCHLVVLAQQPPRGLVRSR